LFDRKISSQREKASLKKKYLVSFLNSESNNKNYIKDYGKKSKRVLLPPRELLFSYYSLIIIAKKKEEHSDMSFESSFLGILFTS